MKMTKDHFKMIEVGMKETIAHFPKNYISKSRLMGKSDGRIAWDIFNHSVIDELHSTTFICNVLYKYLNDDHIRTAIMKIFKTFKEGV